MKTEEWLLLGAAGLAAFWLLGQRQNGQTIGESLGSGIGSGVAGAAVGVVSGTVGGAYSSGASIGEGLAQQFNEAFFNPAVPSQNLINQGQGLIDDFTAGISSLFGSVPSLGWAGLGWF